MLDFSSSITHANFAMKQATTFLNSLYAATRGSHVHFRVAAYSFSNGAVKQSVGPKVLVTAEHCDTFETDMIAMLQARPPGRKTAIGKALVSVSDLPWFQEKADSKFVVLFSDGDLAKVIEDDSNFISKLAMFKSNMAGRAPKMCLYPISNQMMQTSTINRKRLWTYLDGSDSGCFDWALAGKSSWASTWFYDLSYAWTHNPGNFADIVASKVINPLKICFDDHPGGCTCKPDNNKILDMFCNDCCYECKLDTTTRTTTSTSTTSSSSTTTTTTTSSSTTMNCGCHDCMECVDECVAEFNGLNNTHFDPNLPGNTKLAVPPYWHKTVSDITKALKDHANQFYGVAPYDIGSLFVPANTGSYKTGAYITLGGIWQPTVLTAKLQATYRLSFILAEATEHDFTTCKVSIVEGYHPQRGMIPSSRVLASRTYEKGKKPLLSHLDLLRGVALEFEFSAWTPGKEVMSVLFEPVVEKDGRLYPERQMVIIDNVTLCEQTNVCENKYPICPPVHASLIAAVDMSGSIYRKQKALRQAINTITKIHERTKNMKPTAPEIEFSLFIFHRGPAELIFPGPHTGAPDEQHPHHYTDMVSHRLADHQPDNLLTDATIEYLEATFTDLWVLQNVGVKFPLHGFPTIGAALQSIPGLMAHQHHPATVSNLVVFSDAQIHDPYETPEAFTRGMNDFYSNTENISKQTCVYALQSTSGLKYRNYAKLSNMTSYSSPGCKLTVIASVMTGTVVHKNVYGVALNAMVEDIVFGDIQSKQVCHEGPPDLQCTCALDNITEAECCDDLCYPSTSTSTTSTTSTSTATTSSTSTTTTTSTSMYTVTTSSTSTRDRQCPCNECIECDRKPDCSFSGIVNPNFEADRVTGVGARINGKVPSGWVLVDDYVRTDFDHGGSAVTRRTSLGFSNQELYLAAGTVRQKLSFHAKKDQTYVLSAKVSVETGYKFSGGSIALRAGNLTLTSKQVPADYVGFGGMRETAEIQIAFTPIATTAEVLEIELSVPPTDTLMSDPSMTLFDDVTLCVSSNECRPKYPLCQQADINIVLLVDLSGSIASIKGSLEMAVEVVRALHHKLYTPGADIITDKMISQILVSVFTFHLGDATALTLRQSLEASSTNMVIDKLRGAEKTAPINAGTTIGRAVKSLTKHPEFRALWRDGADATVVVLVSDGDPQKYTESFPEFKENMQLFKQYINNMCADGYWMCASGDQCIPEEGHCDPTATFDCEDGSDELDPTCSILGGGFPVTTASTPAAPTAPAGPLIDVSLVCGALQWQCDDKSACIQYYFRCDGYRDCNDGSDEHATACMSKAANPLVAACTARIDEVWMCSVYDADTATAPPCVPNLFACDGKFDCQDKSDESAQACRSVGRSLDSTTAVPSTGTDIAVDTRFCQKRGTQLWMCAAGVSNFGAPCIPSTYLCDNVQDCEDGSDEDPSICVGELVGGQPPLTAITTRSPTQKEQPHAAVVMCTGKKTNKGQLCWCGATCHACTYDSTLELGAPGQVMVCSKCKKRMVLLQGVCVEAQACSSVGGVVRFKLKLCAPLIFIVYITVLLSCVPVSKFLQTLRNYTPVFRANNGKPLEACIKYRAKKHADVFILCRLLPPTYTFIPMQVKGSGNFGQKCIVAGSGKAVPLPAPTLPFVKLPANIPLVCTGKKSSIGNACWCAHSCHTCDFTDGKYQSCSVCKNNKHLLNGLCINKVLCESMEGVTVGTGKFGRLCQLPTDSSATQSEELKIDVAIPDLAGPPPGGVKNTVCTGKKTEEGKFCWCGGGCHECKWAVASSAGCTQCKGGNALFKGSCITVAACVDLSGTVSRDHVYVFPGSGKLLQYNSIALSLFSLAAQ